MVLLVSIQGINQALHLLNPPWELRKSKWRLGFRGPRSCQLAYSSPKWPRDEKDLGLLADSS